MTPRSRPHRTARLAAFALVALLALPGAVHAEKRRWYDRPLRALDVTVDVAVVRPLAALTLGLGAVLFVPAALLSAPGGRDAIQEAWERFVQHPGEQVWERPLGEF